MPFETTAVTITSAGPGRWQLEHPVLYAGATDLITVPRLATTDFATIPQLLLWLIPRDGAHTLAAILHDHCCTEGIRSGAISSRDADGLFRRTLRELGVGPVRRRLLWAGVRIGAWFSPLRRPGSLRDLPAVLAIALLAAPVVVPPTVVAATAYAVYWVIEQAALATAWARTNRR